MSHSDVCVMSRVLVSMNKRNLKMTHILALLEIKSIYPGIPILLHVLYITDSYCYPNVMYTFFSLKRQVL